jgi:peptidoglycan-associated lipoprotein
MRFSLVPVVLAFALVACKAPVKLDSASVEDKQAAAAAAEKSPTPILGSSLLKDAANAARSAGNVAPLDLSAKDANSAGVGAGSLARSNASGASSATGAAGSGAAGSGAAGSGAAGSAADASAAARLAASAAAEAAAASLKERIVYFDFDSFVIRIEARPLIEAHARRLRADAKLRVALEGHTDERGGREYNLGLGQKRADAVRKALSLLGVADTQMEAVSFGKEKPAVPGNSEAAMQENRRVEINYR